MPKTVVVISDEGVKILHEFLGVLMENKHKIYNEPQGLINVETLRIGAMIT